MHLFRVAIALALMSTPASVFAQEQTEPTANPQTPILNSAVAAVHTLINEERARPLKTQKTERDTLANGVLIGAVIGGAAMGVFATVLCNALHEEGNPPCWRGVLAISAVGAGIGAAAGAGIDAALYRRRPLFSVKTRF
jgi:hypothetical protein